MRKQLIVTMAFTLAAGGCASQQKRFERIVPGMSQEDVRKTMDSGPTRFENIESTEYAAWHWGEDYCVLFRNGAVVAKDASQVGRAANAGPASYEEKRRAQCLAPGQAADATTDRSVNIPGIGKIQLPQSELRQPAKER